VAAAFAAFFTEMPLASPAGAGAVVWGRGERYEVLDFFTAMPGLGLNRFDKSKLDFFPVSVDFGPTIQEFHVGRGATSVPMALTGLLDLHDRGGQLPLSQVLEPAIALGRDGARVSDAVGWIIRLLKPIMTHTAGISELSCVDGELVKQGQFIRNTALADVLSALGTGKRKDVVGDINSSILSNFGPESGGLLTREDLQSHLCQSRTPLQLALGDCTVFTNPPPSSGGILIALGLGLAEALKIGETGFYSAEHMQRLCRVLKGVSEARTVGLEEVLRGRLDTSAFLADRERWLAGPGLSGPENYLGSTTHISVLDSFGGSASLTMSNGEGCGHVLPGFGIHMNNFLGEEDINPAGFHTLAPGALMTTMMAPTIVARDGKPILVSGSGGSNRIRSVILQVLVNQLLFGRSLRESIEASRCHIEGDALWFEQENLAPEAIAVLERACPHVAIFPEANMYFGGVHSVAQNDGEYVGVGDVRRDGVAQVVDE
jgi:gamma-glutamyltranspeptidase/glutathione hydrolase